MSPTTHVLLDLDGTLSDPREGIVRCIQHALSSLGREPRAAEQLLWCIGPPLHRSFAELLGGDSEVERAVALYRERFTEIGIREQSIYEGALPTLHELRRLGFKLLLVTSKPRVYAERIVADLKLSSVLNSVHGAELDGSLSGKTELICHVLRQQALSPECCVMVGDRKHDLIGARANDVTAIGVSWGFGSREELLAAEPLAVVDTFAELLLRLGQPG